MEGLASSGSSFNVKKFNSKQDEWIDNSVWYVVGLWCVLCLDGRACRVQEHLEGRADSHCVTRVIIILFAVGASRSARCGEY